MCGIWCTSRRDMFEILYDANRDRGTFATGAAILKEKNSTILKKQGTIDFNKIELDPSGELFIGHAQSPTSGERNWAEMTSHPFRSPDWMVFHNGVISNFTELKKSYQSKLTSVVDTSIITTMLQHFTDTVKSKKCPPHVVIKQVLELLQGTFALIIIHTNTNKVYMARQGSILHYNDKGDCSTMPGLDWKPVPEGEIFQRMKSSWKSIDTFKSTSPFLFV